MPVRSIHLLLLVTVLPAMGLCQVLPFQKYSTRDGLIADRITAIQQDNKGFIWLGSYFGICRYNGTQFEKIQLPAQQQNKFVAAILPVGEKVYCSFFLQGGLAEIYKGKVTPYQAPNGGDIVCMYNDGAEGLLIATSINDIYQFRNGKFTLLYDGVQPVSGARPYGLLKDRDGNIWMGTESGLLIIPANKKIATIHLYDNNFIFSLQKTQGGKIWVCAFDGLNGQIRLFSGLSQGEPVQLLDIQIPLLRPVVYATNTTSDCWFVTYDKGLCRVNESGSITYFKTAVEHNSDINFIFNDRELNLWIANDPGVMKITNFSALSYYFDELAPGGGSILLLEQAQLVNNSKYLYKITDDGIQKIEFREPGVMGYMGVMYTDINHNIWISRWDQGFWRTQWQDTAIRLKQYYKEYNNIPLTANTYASDGRGNVWTGGIKGLIRLHDGKVTEVYYPENTHSFFLTSLTIDTVNKMLWGGDNTQGVFGIHYQEQPDGSFHYTITDSIKAKNGLSDLYIRSILYDSKGNLWVGTRVGGIYRIQQTGSHNYSVTNVSKSVSKDCSRVPAIVEEKNKGIWFATNNGVYKYLYDEDGWEHYTVSDGILSSEIFSIAFDEHKKEIWALTIEGVSRINIREAKVTRTSPLVSLSAITVLGKADSSALFSDREKKFSSSQNSIGFVFAGASFIDEKQVLYRYQLEGYDKELSDPVATNNVNYASLPPGSYTFRVFASNAQGTWSEKPATFTFRITSPFYQSPWFFIGIITIAALLFYFFRIDRLKQQYKIEKVRLGIARDLHDDIGSALGSINILSKTANRKLQKSLSTEEIAGTFNKIGESAQSTLESMDDIIWTINPEKDKLEDLIVRMREFAIPLLEARDIRFGFELVSADYERVPMNARRNIFLIFKEAIHNIIKHADCTSVNIITGIKNNQFMLQVTDDGKGFEPEFETNRHGLQNMFHRAALSNGKLSIESTPEGGTRILFTVKIK